MFLSVGSDRDSRVWPTGGKVSENLRAATVAQFFYVHSDASHSDLSTVFSPNSEGSDLRRQVTVVITTLQCSRCSDVEALMFVSAFCSRSIQIIRRFQA